MTVASNFMSMVVVGLLDSLLGCSTKWADTLQQGHRDCRQDGQAVPHRVTC
jgi:hypothetical protein